MSDTSKTKKQLIAEIQELRDQVYQLRTELKARASIPTPIVDTQEEPSLWYENGQRAAEEALRQQQHFIQQLVDTAPILTYVVDIHEQKNIFSNLEFIRKLGYTPAELQRLGSEIISRLIHPDDLPRLIQHYDKMRTMQNDDVRELEYRIKTTSGEWCWLYSYDRPFVRDAEGLTVQVLGVAIDVTKRRQAEEALRTSEQRFATLAEEAPIGIYQMNHNCGIVYTNRGYTEIAGMDNIEQINRDWLNSIHPDDQKLGMERWLAMVQGQAPSALSEFRFRRPDGRLIWIQGYGVPQYDETGTIVGYIGTISDQTERKQAQEALQQTYDQLMVLNHELSESRDVLRTLFDELNDAFVLLSSSDQVLAVNRAMAVLVGQPLKQLIGQNWNNCHELSIPLVKETRLAGRPLQSRQTINLPNGTRRTLDIRTYPLFAASASVDRLIIHIIDISEQLALEAMALQNERLATAGRLAATVAHEVNTPLQAIQCSLFLAAKAQGEAQEHYFRVISSEIERLSKILRQLLSSPKLNNSIDQTTNQTIDINSTVEQVLLITRGKMNEQHVVAVPTLDGSLTTIPGRTDYLTQVLLNLVLNGIDAMENGGTLHIRTRSEKEAGASSVLIEVEDTGLGIPPELLQRIFDPFFTTKRHGTGIGLAVSQRLVQQLGGTLSVQSEVGKGTLFTVRIQAS